MVRRGATVSIRVHPTIKAVIDYVVAQHRAQTRQGMTNDEALWAIFKKGAPEAVEAVLAMGAEEPVDARKKTDKGDQDTDATE